MDKKKKKKSKKKNILRLLLIIIVLVYFTIRSIPILIASKAKTTPIENGTIVESVDCKGIVLRDEIVYRAESQGDISFKVKSGTKVGKGIKIAEIKNETFNNYKKELEEVDRKIEEHKKRLSSQNDILKEDIKKNQDEIDYIMVSLQNNISEQNYEEVKRLKDRLLIVTNKKDAISSEKKLVADQIDTMMKKRNEIVQKMKNSSLTYYSQTAGIVSTTIDGLESKFSSKEVDKYTISDYKLLKEKKITVKDKNAVKVGNPIFKILEEQEWFIMFKVDNDRIDEIKEGDSISINLVKRNEKLKGTVVKLDKSKKETLLIVKFKDYLHKFHNERYIDLQLIKESYEGLKIHNSSIVEKEGVQGVFIKDVSGIVKFVPIKILGKDDEYSIIEEGLNSQIEIMNNGKKELVTTLKLFDEVFLDGSKVKDGQIVDYNGGD